jgi:hypothetical protein
VNFLLSQLASFEYYHYGDYLFSYFGSIRLIFEIPEDGDVGPRSISSTIRDIAGLDISISTFFTGLKQDSIPEEITKIYLFWNGKHLFNNIILLQ